MPHLILFSVAVGSMDVDEIVAKAEKMLNEGADILDIGGQSTRPGSELISAEEEIERVIPAIKAIAKKILKRLFRSILFIQESLQQLLMPVPRSSMI
jgi:dihydropteroate synthase